ncbi:hypothetical protein [Echinicola rosea]|uniref:hypothetical protein n=1 Tax=Echinicola rosea TaxID=1807691 RepID=UPI001651AA78|nr:hypothetical protein [Echinicola rosea]
MALSFSKWEARLTSFQRALLFGFLLTAWAGAIVLQTCQTIDQGPVSVPETPPPEMVGPAMDSTVHQLKTKDHEKIQHQTTDPVIGPSTLRPAVYPGIFLGGPGNHKP